MKHGSWLNYRNLKVTFSYFWTLRGCIFKRKINIWKSVVWDARRGFSFEGKLDEKIGS